MRAGKLDRLVTIQRNTPSEDEFGQPIASWSAIKNRVPASYRPLRGEERFTSAQLIAREQAEFKIRYDSTTATITSKDRIIYPALETASPEPTPDDDAIWDIIQAPEIGRREGIRIVAARRPDVG